MGMPAGWPQPRSSAAPREPTRRGETGKPAGLQANCSAAAYGSNSQPMATVSPRPLQRDPEETVTSIPPGESDHKGAMAPRGARAVGGRTLTKADLRGGGYLGRRC